MILQIDIPNDKLEEIELAVKANTNFYLKQAVKNFIVNHVASKQRADFDKEQEQEANDFTPDLTGYEL